MSDIPVSVRQRRSAYEPPPIRVSDTDPCLTYEELIVIKSGSFGKVAKCRNLLTHETVVLKYYATIPDPPLNLAMELCAYRLIGQDNDCHIVRVLDTLLYNSRLYIVFEFLQQSLKDFQIDRKFEPLLLQYIRPIAWQIVNALLKLKSLDFVHCDVKLDSIMLVDHPRLPFLVKLTDFKSCRLIGRCERTTELQTLCYRAPEILLGLPYTEAIDMWSLGQVMAELFLGKALCPGTTEQDVIRGIHQKIAPFPSNMLNASEASNKIYAENLSGLVAERLSSSFSEIPIRAFDRVECFLLVTDRCNFVAFLQQILCIDPDRRLTAFTAHAGDFLSVQHLSRFAKMTMYPNTQTRYKEIIAAMDICKRSSNEPYHYLS